MRILVEGMSGHDVAELQAAMAVLGEPTPVDGAYTAITTRSVLRLQQRLNMTVDGRADPLFQAGVVSAASGRQAPKVPAKGKEVSHFARLRVVVAATSADGIISKLNVLKTILKNEQWGLSVAGSLPVTQEVSAWAAKYGVEAVCEPSVETNPNKLKNLALLRLVSTGSQAGNQFVWVMDGTPLQGLLQFFNAASASSKLAVVAPYAVRETDTLRPERFNLVEIKPDQASQVDGRWPSAAVIFHRSLIVGSLFLDEFESKSDGLVWLKWLKDGVKFSIVDVPAVAELAERPPVSGALTEARRKLLDTSFERKKVSALLLTGKCKERYPLTRVAIDCFLRQTWPNKELVIINHGEESLGGIDPRIREVMINRTRDMTLGDLRNISIEAATGEWCIQWDDDDWHHPTRMETQMKRAEAETICTYLWQIRLNMYDGIAFYDEFPEGQHMSILFSRATKHRYPKLDIREDTAFFAKFKGGKSVIDNGIDNIEADPLQYVRTYHGRNIWDADHIMRGSLVNYPESRLIDWHALKIAEIMDEYRAQPGFTLPDNPPTAPDVP